MGPQSSGKSTLLNVLFGTKFFEMDALSRRGQTTQARNNATSLNSDRAALFCFSAALIPCSSGLPCRPLATTLASFQLGLRIAGTPLSRVAALQGVWIAKSRKEGVKTVVLDLEASSLPWLHKPQYLFWLQSHAAQLLRAAPNVAMPEARFSMLANGCLVLPPRRRRPSCAWPPACSCARLPASEAHLRSVRRGRSSFGACLLVASTGAETLSRTASALAVAGHGRAGARRGRHGVREAVGTVRHGHRRRAAGVPPARCMQGQCRARLMWRLAPVAGQHVVPRHRPRTWCWQAAAQDRLPGVPAPRAQRLLPAL